MCTSVLYTVNTATTAAALDAPINLGTVIRRKNCGLSADGSVIRLEENGYYAVDVSATFTAAAAGNVTLTLYKDGVPVPGALATQTVTTAVAENRSVSIPAVVRQSGSCCDTGSLTVVASGNAPTISNLAVRVEHI